MLTGHVLRTRFGYGFGPQAAPVTPDALIGAAAGPDLVAARYPVVSFADAMALESRRHKAHLAAQKGNAEAKTEVAALRTTLRATPLQGVRAAFARILDSDAPLRERLTWFWADHFTVSGRNISQAAGTAGYVDEAIRPHVMGRFADMLKAVGQHPAMLAYLDQHASVGPRSPHGQRTGRGLNENFARELLELHTLGVGDAYTQVDVRETAELLTGLSLNKSRGFAFRNNMAEPGPETVLGETYGSDADAQLEDVTGFLDDLARHPVTVRHLATKLVVHFVSSDPPPSLVDDLIDIWGATDGDLAAVTAALVRHPLAQTEPLHKVKAPMTFMASVMLALGLRGTDIAQLEQRDVRRILAGPLSRMGQPFLRAPGPDGWSEDAADWITPQGLAARIGWAVWSVRLWGQGVDDPLAFLDRTLPGRADGTLRFAVAGAETRADALTLVLASPAFNRS